MFKDYQTVSWKNIFILALTKTTSAPLQRVRGNYRSHVFHAREKQKLMNVLPADQDVVFSGEKNSVSLNIRLLESRGSYLAHLILLQSYNVPAHRIID